MYNKLIFLFFYHFFYFSDGEFLNFSFFLELFSLSLYFWRKMKLPLSSYWCWLTFDPAPMRCQRDILVCWHLVSLFSYWAMSYPAIMSGVTSSRKVCTKLMPDLWQAIFHHIITSPFLYLLFFVRWMKEMWTLGTMLCVDYRSISAPIWCQAIHVFDCINLSSTKQFQFFPLTYIIV